MDIKYLHNSEIDYKKWDWCISKAFNSIIYAYSWYLDVVSPGWDALVSDNYKIIMPLTHKTKYGIKIFVQPILTQQLGVFSIKKMSPSIVKQFIIEAHNHFRYIDINLNKLNSFDAVDFQIRKKVTYELELIHSYEKLKRIYSTNHKRNIKKALNNKINIINSVTTNQLIKLMKDNLEFKISELNEERYDQIRKIISSSIRYRTGELSGAYNEKNELIASAFFIFNDSKCIFLFGATTTEGKKTSAMFLLFDRFIKKYSEKNLILDFEGSEMPGLARFYGGFGAKPFHYLNIKKNNLPWYVRLIKNKQYGH